jgi:putative tryptophan/tyrosine transport system substrate-binding protein
MRRREFITLLGGAVSWPLTARAQQSEEIRRVGVLTPYTKQDFVDRDDVAAFEREFRRLGWEEGRNFHLEYRGVPLQQLRSAAAELVALKSEVILVLTPPALRAAQASTDTIPIVFVRITDPLSQGFVANLAHPGGNVTGFSSFAFSMGSKWLQLLKEIAPDLRHFALIFHPATTPGGWLPVIQSAAPVFGLEVNEAAVNDENEIDDVIDVFKTSSDAGVMVLPSPFTMLHRQQIIDFAARHQLPAVYWDGRFVKDGGLVSLAYGLDDEERLGATYVDRILKGATPGDLPVQETKKFELVINLKTAKALGLTVSPSLLARADEVIE